MQVDHVVPIELGHIVMAEGGDPNNLKNCLPACRSCNYIKSSMMPEKFRRYISGLIESLARDSVTYRNAVRFGMVEEKPHTPQFYFEKLGVKTAGYLSDFDEMYRKNVVRLEKEEEAE